MTKKGWDWQPNRGAPEQSERERLLMLRGERKDLALYT